MIIKSWSSGLSYPPSTHPLQMLTYSRKKVGATWAGSELCRQRYVSRGWMHTCSE